MDSSNYAPDSPKHPGRGENIAHANFGSFSEELTDAALSSSSAIIFLITPRLGKTQDAGILISRLMAQHKIMAIDQTRIPLIRIVSRPSDPATVQCRMFWIAAVAAVENVGGTRETNGSRSKGGMGKSRIPIASLQCYFQMLVATKETPLIVVDDTVFLGDMWFGLELMRLSNFGPKIVLIGSEQFQRSMRRDQQIARRSVVIRIH